MMASCNHELDGEEVGLHQLDHISSDAASTLPAHQIKLNSKQSASMIRLWYYSTFYFFQQLKNSLQYRQKWKEIMWVSSLLWWVRWDNLLFTQFVSSYLCSASPSLLHAFPLTFFWILQLSSGPLHLYSWIDGKKEKNCFIKTIFKIKLKCKSFSSLPPRLRMQDRTLINHQNQIIMHGWQHERLRG